MYTHITHIHGCLDGSTPTPSTPPHARTRSVEDDDDDDDDDDGWWWWW
jgi:hypothetical protein